MASDRVQRRLDRLLDQIDEAEAQGNWESVRSLALDVLEFDGENSEASAYLRVAERRLAENTAVAEQPKPTPGPTEGGNSALPTSFASGRYQVKRFLGEGGKKKVYLAQDTLLDREVAFALIKTEGLDDISRTRITREAQAMGRLGSHPHIVTVFDLGQEADQPYMVTELMGGGDVEGVIEDATDHRLPLEQAIEIAKETCRGLEFAHSRGIVHRDLKPGNVWLTENGVAKIGDFGLAVAIDRSRLTTEGMMVGTVSYMPPEQAMGGEVTPRSDLYSLGAMLYEMVTGRPPFLGDDSVAIIGQHINTPPVAPTWHNGQCPRPLEALILRLLAKDPSERPQSATDVLAALEGLDLTTTAESSVEEAQPLDSLAGGVFVGRQREMGELKACLEDALSGRGRLVTLVGEPGIGKTRTAQELATYAGLRSAQVLWGRCYKEQGMPPYWPWVQAIRSYVREREPDQLRSEMGAGAADIAEVVSDVKEHLPDLKPPPQLDSPEQARFRLFDSITAFLKLASLKQPLVLVLDDLHWADQPSLLLLQFVARELGNSRLLLVGTYRDMELSRQHPLAETLGELSRERLFQRVLLRGLSQQDVGRFIEVAAGVDPPAGLTEAVHTQTEGNPLFVTEVVRLLVQEGELTQESGNRDSWTVRIPEGVREVIGRRLNRLSQRCNETLTIASVIGREFELRQLTPLVEDMSEDRLLEVLEEALAARVIEELPQVVGRYHFTHALIQETLTEELTLTRRVRLHATIAESLERLYGENLEAHAPELAHHFSEAKSILGTDRLVRYSLLAGERALAAYAHDDALTYFRRGLMAREIELSGDEVPPDEEAAALLFGLGRAQVALLPVDQLHSAVAILRRAFEYYSETQDLDRVVAIAETPLPPMAGHHTGMSQLLARALELVPAASLAAGRLLSLRGRVSYMEEGDYEGAQAAFNESLEIARREGSGDLELRTLVDAAEVALYHNQIKDLLTLSLRAVDLTSMVDDPRGEALANFYASISHTIRGEPGRATQFAEAGIAAAQRLRHHFYLARTLAVREYVARLLGQWQTALELCNSGLAVSPRESRLLFGRVLTDCQIGEFDSAEARLDELFEVMQLNPSGPTVDRAFFSLSAPLAARITGVVDRSKVSEEAAHTVLSNSSAIPIVVEITKYGPSLLAVQRGDAAAAREQYGSMALTGIGIIFGLPDSQILGLLAQTMGELDQAMAHFEDALDFCRRAGYRPVLAMICCDYADTLLQRNEPGDRGEAMSLLDESLAISSELGMRPLMERVLSRRDILKA